MINFDLTNKSLLHLYWAGSLPNFIVRNRLKNLITHLKTSQSEFIPLLWVDRNAYESIERSSMFKSPAKVQYQPFFYSRVNIYWHITAGVPILVINFDYVKRSLIEHVTTINRRSYFQIRDYLLSCYQLAKRYQSYTHCSDIARLVCLAAFTGIYCDIDIVLSAKCFYKCMEQIRKIVRTNYPPNFKPLFPSICDLIREEPTYREIETNLLIALEPFSVSFYNRIVPGYEESYADEFAKWKRFRKKYLARSYRNEPYFNELVVLFGNEDPSYYRRANKTVTEALYQASFDSGSYLNNIPGLVFSLSETYSEQYDRFFTLHIKPYFNIGNNLGYSWATPTYNEIRKLEATQVILAQRIRDSKKADDK